MVSQHPNRTGKARQGVPIWTYVAEPVTAHKQLLLDEFEGESVIDGLKPEIPEAEIDRMLAALPSPATAHGAGG